MDKYPHINEFSKNSNFYNNYNYIQKIVAKDLISKIDFKPKKILDIGCGSGVVYSLIDWEVEEFVGIDLSKEMLSLHPKAKNITLKQIDFDKIDPDFLKKFDLVISSSSLHWSKDLDFLLKKIKENSKYFCLSIFCDKTFQSIRNFLEIDTFLPNMKILKNKNKDIFCEAKEYKLYFKTPYEQLKYIKKSGVSGGKKRANLRKIRSFLKEYKKKELEFEVLFMLKTP